MFLVVSAALLLLSLASVYFRWKYGDHAAIEGLFLAKPGFDLWDYTARFADRHSPVFFTLPGYSWYYPAPAIFVLYPFYRITLSHLHCYVLYLAVVSTCSLVMAGLFGRALTRSGLAPPAAYSSALASLLLSWPIYFAMQRGNIEALTWLVLAVGIWFWIRNQPRLAAIFIGVVGSVKL